MKRKRLLLAAVAGSLAALARAQVFDPPVLYTVGQEAIQIRLADLDQRLGPDLVVANRNGSSVMMLPAQGDGTFDAPVVVAAVTFPEDLLAYDRDRDGDVDLAVTTQGGTGSPELVLLRNQGDGTFTTTRQNTLSFGVALCTADFDRDGDADLAAANVNADTVTIFLANALGTYTEAGSYAVGDNPVAIAAVDLDLANGPDLAVAHLGGTDGVSVLLNSGGASFPSFTDHPVTAGGTPLAVAAADLDGVLGPDLVTANSLTGDVSVLLATGGGLFAAATATAVPGGGSPAALAVADLDDDGDLDVVVGQRTGRSVSVLLGDGAGALAAEPGSPYALALPVMALASTDLDFDNAPDVAVATTDTADPASNGVAAVLGNALGPFGPVVTTATLPDAAMGAAYRTTLSASGGTPPYTWDLAAGSLPSGMTLNPSTGVIAGTPGFAAVGTRYFTVRARDAAFLTGIRPLALTVVSPASLVAAKGSGSTSAYNQRLAGYEADGTPVAALSFGTYTLSGYGARLGRGNLDGGGFEEILVSPGPGDNHPPAVRAYDRTGVPIPYVDYFAYPVLRYGAGSTGAGIDGTGNDEILTAPGPGPTFGPQVRGWSYDGTTFPQAISAVNFYAYSTLKFGANVDGSDQDGDDIAEIVTGAGPGIVFGPHVRGFDYDGQALGVLPGLSFFAYSTLSYGVNPAGAALDAAGGAEILTGPGPGMIFGAHLRGFRYGGAGVGDIGNLSSLVFTTRYGLNVSAADIEADGFDEPVVGSGPDPAAPSILRAYQYDGAALSGPTFDENPFGLAFGVRATGAALGY